LAARDSPWGGGGQFFFRPNFRDLRTGRAGALGRGQLKTPGFGNKGSRDAEKNKSFHGAFFRGICFEFGGEKGVGGGGGEGAPAPVAFRNWGRVNRPRFFPKDIFLDSGFFFFQGGGGPLPFCQPGIPVWATPGGATPDRGSTRYIVFGPAQNGGAGVRGQTGMGGGGGDPHCGGWGRCISRISISGAGAPFFPPKGGGGGGRECFEKTGGKGNLTPGEGTTLPGGDHIFGGAQGNKLF